MARYLLPLPHISFAVVTLTAAAMFVAIARSVTTSAVAAWKFGLIGLVGLNIVVFHAGIYRTVGAGHLGPWTPLWVQATAAVSALCCMSVIVAVRFLAY